MELVVVTKPISKTPGLDLPLSVLPRISLRNTLSLDLIESRSKIMELFASSQVVIDPLRDNSFNISCTYCLCLERDVENREPNNSSDTGSTRLRNACILPDNTGVLVKYHDNLEYNYIKIDPILRYAQ